MPAIYCPLARMAENGFRVVSPDTDLVIEGYPRSGNSYVEAAFRISQGPKILLAHHTHAAANVLRAVALNKPCYVLIRLPEDAIVSLVIHDPNVQDLKLALHEYELFYSAIAHLARDICIAPFDLVTRDFNVGVALLNERYGTAFRPLPEGVGFADIMEVVDDISRKRKTVSDGVEPYSPHAAEEVRNARNILRAKVRLELGRPEYAPALRRCNDLYSFILRRAGIIVAEPLKMPN